VPPRTRLTEDERADIIDAAYACLSSPHQGPVSVAAILDAASLSTRAFYRHFASKDELFLAMLKRDSEAVTRRLRRVAETAGGPEAQLRAWIDCLLGLAYHPRMRAHVVVLDSDEVRVAKGYREASADLRAERERVLADILRLGRDDGSFPLAEPERDAAAIHAVVDRAFAAPLSGLGPDRELLVGYVLDFALRALGATQRR
jgi:AcrR family transcriptional regulator